MYKLKPNWWLNTQVLGGIAFAVRCIPLVAPLHRRINWYVSADIKKFPPVSIIVPARNEEHNILNCINSLLRQDYPDFEIVAVDDGSTDATPTILKQLADQDNRLKVVRVDEQLPEGWAGKPHAMFNGVKHARPESEFLLFTDADTKHEPAALRQGVAKAIESKLDLFSVLTNIEMKSFWERVLMPIVVLGIVLQYPLEQVNSPKSKLAIANGQFLLVRRKTYKQVGGWEGKLRNSILDDRDMAVAVKSSGGKIQVEDGRELVSVRMYTNFREIWAGWRKNAFVGSRASFVSFPLFITTAIYMGLFPFGQIPYALFKLWRLRGAKGERKQQERARTKRLLTYSAFTVSLNFLVRWWLDKGLGVPTKYTLTNPLGTTVIIGILLDSMWRSITGRGLSWKGRNYQNATKTQQML